jgi:flagellar motor switch protein FliM
MATEELLDLPGIDAVLSRFRARRAAQAQLGTKTSQWEVDHPAVLRPESYKTLHLRFRSIADRLSSDLSASLRSHVRVTLQKLDAMRLRTLVDGMPPRTSLFILDVAELPLPGFLRMDGTTITSMIDRMLGGRGLSGELTRDLTAIEQRVVRDAVNMVVSHHQSTLAMIKPLTMKWTRCFGTPEELRPLPGTEVFLAADYEISVDSGIEWTLSFALPLGPLVSSIDSVSSLPLKQQEKREDRRERMERALQTVSVDTTVAIGHTTLTVDEVMHLAPGDVLVLDTRKQDLVDFKVEGVTKYRGRLGKTQARLTFKVLENRSAAPRGGGQKA